MDVITLAFVGFFVSIGIIFTAVTLIEYFFGKKEIKTYPCRYYDVCRLRMDNEVNQTPVGMFSYRMQEYYKKKFSGH